MKSFKERLGLLRLFEDRKMKSSGQRFDVGDSVDDNLDYRDALDDRVSFIEKLKKLFF